MELLVFPVLHMYFWVRISVLVLLPYWHLWEPEEIVELQKICDKLFIVLLEKEEDIIVWHERVLKYSRISSELRTMRSTFPKKWLMFQ